MKQSISSREINRLAIPSIVTGLAEPIVSMTDTAIVGKIGHQPMSSVGLSSFFVLVIIWLLSAMKGSISSMIGKHYGQGTADQTGRLVSQALIFVMGLCVIIGISTYSFSSQIFNGLYGAEGEILSNSVSYYQIRIFGMPFMIGTYLIFGVFKGFQNTSWAMTITLVGAIINIIFDFIFVLGVGDIIPAYGVSGAASASVIAQFAMFVLAVYYVKKKTNLKLTLSFKIDKEIPRLLLMSFSLFQRTVILNLVFMLSDRFATKISDEAIAAHIIASHFWMFAAYFIDGFSNAGIAIISRLDGADDRKGIYSVSMKLFKKGLLIGFISMLVFFIVRPFVGSIFNENEQVIYLFNSIFLLVALSQPINTIAFILDGIFIGVGKMNVMRNSMVISSVLGFIVPWYIIRNSFPGLTALWISLFIWMGFRALTLAIVFQRSYFKYRMS